MLMSSIVAGCPQNCHGNGRCHSEDGEYRCECSPGYSGFDCSIPLELNCSDEIDNDHGNVLSYVVDLLRLVVLDNFKITGRITFHFQKISGVLSLFYI